MRGGVSVGSHAAFAARTMAGIGFWTFFGDLPPLSPSSSSSTCFPLLPPVSLCFSAPCSRTRSRLSLLCLSSGTAFGYFILFFQDLCRHWWFGLSTLCPQHGCLCSSSWLHMASARKSTSISVARAGVTEDKRSLVMLQFFFAVLLGAARTPARASALNGCLSQKTPLQKPCQELSQGLWACQSHHETTVDL